MDPQLRSEPWPDVGDNVVLVPHRGDRLAAVVTSATSLSLWLHVGEVQPPAGVNGAPPHAMLEYVADDRAYRIAGEIGIVDHDRHWWRFVASARAVLLQRRADMRTAVSLVIVLASASGTRRLVGRTRNVSAGGALADFSELPRLGERLRFALVPRVGQEVVKGWCRVVRIPPPAGVAVEFESLTPRQCEELANLILRHR